MLALGRLPRLQDSKDSKDSKNTYSQQVCALQNWNSLPHTLKHQGAA